MCTPIHLFLLRYGCQGLVVAHKSCKSIFDRNVLWIDLDAAIFDLLAFLALLLTGLFMGFKAMNADPNVRVFYYINAYVCGVATFAYFAMLSGMGWETIMGCRQFFCH